MSSLPRRHHFFEAHPALSSPPFPRSFMCIYAPYHRLSLLRFCILLTSLHSDVRSVTVWFQNKRQTERRIHRQLSESALQPSSSPTTSSLPPSSPFSDASGNTIHTARARTRTLSGNSSTSAMSPTSATRKRDRDADHDAEATAISTASRHVRQKPSRHFSLDDIAARSERPAHLPRTPPQCIASSSSCSSSPMQPQTPETRPLSLSPSVRTPGEEGMKGDGKMEADARQRALWENMPSSPVAPDPVPHQERDLVRYGSRRLTLEYACAREMVGARGVEREPSKTRGLREPEREPRRKKKHGHKHHSRQEASETSTKEKTDGGARGERTRVRGHIEDGEDDIPVADWDMHGDTDTEGVLSEAPVTPSSSFGFGDLSVIDEHTKSQKDAIVDGIQQGHPRKIEIARNPRDEDMMDAAYILCNFSQRG